MKTINVKVQLNDGEQASLAGLKKNGFTLEGIFLQGINAICQEYIQTEDDSNNPEEYRIFWKEYERISKRLNK